MKATERRIGANYPQHLIDMDDLLIRGRCTITDDEAAELVERLCALDSVKRAIERRRAER